MVRMFSFAGTKNYRQHRTSFLQVRFVHLWRLCPIPKTNLITVIKIPLSIQIAWYYENIAIKSLSKIMSSTQPQLKYLISHGYFLVRIVGSQEAISLCPGICHHHAVGQVEYRKPETRNYATSEPPVMVATVNQNRKSIILMQLLFGPSWILFNVTEHTMRV